MSLVLEFIDIVLQISILLSDRSQLGNLITGISLGLCLSFLQSLIASLTGVPLAYLKVDYALILVRIPLGCLHFGGLAVRSLGPFLEKYPLSAPFCWL